MSDPVPVFGPDGQVYQVPPENVGTALANNGKLAVNVLSPDGIPHYVPHDKLGDALANGGRLSSQDAHGTVGMSSFDAAPYLSKAIGISDAVDRGAAPDSPEVMAGRSGLSNAANAFGRGVVQTLIQPAFHPLDALKGLGTAAINSFPPVALARALAGKSSPGEDIGNAVIQDFKQNGALAIPHIGGQIAGALAGGKLIEVVGAEPLVPGQNYTPSQAAAYEGLIGKATGMGKNFIPQEVTPQSLSTIRDTVSQLKASSNPAHQALADTITSSNTPPLDHVDAMHQVIQQSLDNLEAQHTPVLAQAAASPVNTTPLTQMLRSRISPLLSDSDNAAIQDLIDRTSQVQNVGDLGKFRQILNTENSPEFRQGMVQAGRSGHSVQASSDLGNAVRNQYYQELQNVTGQDMQPLKLKESNLLTAKEAIENQKSGLAKAEAAYNAPTTLREKAGNLADIIKNPKQVVTQNLLHQSPAAPVSNYIRKSMQNIQP